jgi:hypothetical protein
MSLEWNGDWFWTMKAKSSLANGTAGVTQRSLAYLGKTSGNVGTLIVFRIGHADAEIMEQEFGRTISARALSDLDRYEAVVKLLENGTNAEPFRARMLPPMGIPASSRVKRVAQEELIRKGQSDCAPDFSLFGKGHRLGGLNPIADEEKARSRAVADDTLGEPVCGG